MEKHTTILEAEHLDRELGMINRQSIVRSRRMEVEVDLALGKVLGAEHPEMLTRVSNVAIT